MAEHVAPIQRVVIVGVGNADRGDDDAGPAVIRALAARSLPEAVSLTHTYDPLMLVDLLASAPALLVIDAISAAAEPGTIHRFDASTQRLPIEFSSCSTHALGIAEAIELARMLNAFPRHLTVYGIVGQRFGVGDTLSPEVERAVQRVVDVLVDELTLPLPEGRGCSRPAGESIGGRVDTCFTGSALRDGACPA